MEALELIKQKEAEAVERFLKEQARAEVRSALETEKNEKHNAVLELQGKVEAAQIAFDKAEEALALYDSQETTEEVAENPTEGTPE